MPVIEVTLQVKVDGVPLFGGSPLVRRLEVDAVQPFDYPKGDDGDATTFTTLPIGQIASVAALVVRASGAITLRLNGQTDEGIPLSADGLLLVLDSSGTAATVNNNSDADARLRGFGAGATA